MALYRLDDDQLTTLTATEFATEGVRERADLQRLLAKELKILIPNAMLLTDEFGDWDQGHRRIDMLALDHHANIVVIELKRTNDGGHMELQAIRYAAMVSTLTFKQAVTAHARYLKTDEAQAEELILSFLGWDEPQEDLFGQDVRIVLASADFSREVTTAVMWLNQKGLDITCVRMRPHRNQGQLLLDVQRLIPLPEAEDYLVRARSKQRQQREQQQERQETGYWFVNIGENPRNERCWEDAMKYGFVSAGGGSTWRHQIEQLGPGDRFFAYLTGHGYVGVGTVLESAVLMSEFTPPGHDRRLTELPLTRQPSERALRNAEVGDYCVAVSWDKTLPRDEAISDEARRHAVCRLLSPALVERLLEAFSD